MTNAVPVEAVQIGARYRVIEEGLGDDVIVVSKKHNFSLPCWCDGSQVHVWVEGEPQPRHFPPGTMFYEL